MSDYSDLILAASPVLYWRLGISGTTDISGNGRDATINAGSVSVGGHSPGAIAGDADTATELNGSTQTVGLVYNPMAASSTFEIWAWRDATADDDTIVSMTDGSDTQLGLAAGNHNVYFRVNGNAATWAAAWPGTGQWVHCVLTFVDATNTAELFINGVSQGTQSQTTTWPAGGNVHLGYGFAGTLYDGKLDEFAIYDTVLSAAQVLAHYEMGANGPAAPTVVRLAAREKPPLRLHVDVTAPSGKHNRWGRDEPDPDNVPANLSIASEMPGGFTTFSATLPRKPNLTYPDTQELSNVRVMGAGGQVAWEGRLESTPRVSGEQMSIAPQAKGYQAHLDDDTSASVVYLDRDMGHWGGMSRTRKLAQIASAAVADGSIATDPTNGIPGAVLAFDGNATTTPQVCEMLYDAGSGNYIGSIYYDFVRGTNTTSSFSALVRTGSSDSSFTTDTANLCASASSLGTLTAGTSHRYAALYFQSPSADGGTDGLTHDVTIRRVTVWGDVDLNKRGTAPDDGLYASDIVAHALRHWAPLLTYSTGTSGSIADTTFIIPHLEFREKTTAGQIISAANRFHLNDWAVWEDKVFYFNERGARGKSWRARVAPAQLEEAGPSVENLWNGAIVAYADVDGTTKRVGPTGSGADTTSTDVEDDDPLNPANELGLKRYAILDMGGVSTAAGATEVGRRFLVESAQYNTSGRAQLVGHVEDDRGVIYPAWRVRAGDLISFPDASFTGYRRIVRTSYDDQSKTCSVDLDAPAEGLSALLDRLSVSLVGVL